MARKTFERADKPDLPCHWRGLCILRKRESARQELGQTCGQVQGKAMKPGILFLTVLLVGCDARPKPEPKPARQRLTPVQIFDLRTKCQTIVDKDVEEFFIAVVGNALRSDVTSHYNPVTNRCYAEVLVTKNFSFNWPQTPANYRSDVLYDAQTRELLLSAKQEGDARNGNDYRADNIFSTYEKVTGEIHLLMTQEEDR